MSGSRPLPFTRTLRGTDRWNLDEHDLKPPKPRSTCNVVDSGIRTTRSKRAGYVNSPAIFRRFLFTTVVSVDNRR